jgi:hypothetical protein
MLWPMLFSRRTVQKSLNSLGGQLPHDILDVLAQKLNTYGQSRLPTMWEVILLSALSRLGQVRHEVVLPSGKRPDLSFKTRGGLEFVADITCVSDAGLDEQNPVEYLADQIEACKKRLGLPIGGLSLRVEGYRTPVRDGERAQLYLPSRGGITELVRTRIEPELRRQMNEGRSSLHLMIDDSETKLTIAIKGDRYNYTSYPGYSSATSKTRNPLYNALDLKRKRGQLKGVNTLAGVIVCDGDCAALDQGRKNWNEFSERQIAEEFLRKNSSIGFVLIVSAMEESGAWPDRFTVRKMTYVLVTQPRLKMAPVLEALFRKMAEHMPKPIDSPVNAALRAKESGYGWGKHGGMEMREDSKRTSVKLSSRMIMEVLAGRRSVEDMHQIQRLRFRSDPQDNFKTLNPFEGALEDGRLPVSIEIEPDPDGSDDWIVFHFGEPDAAVAPFKAPDRKPRRSPVSFIRSLIGKVPNR